MARFFFIFHALSYELNFFRPEVPFKDKKSTANSTANWSKINMLTQSCVGQLALVVTQCLLNASNTS